MYVFALIFSLVDVEILYLIAENIRQAFMDKPNVILIFVALITEHYIYSTVIVVAAYQRSGLINLFVIFKFKS